MDIILASGETANKDYGTVMNDLCIGTIILYRLMHYQTLSKGDAEWKSFVNNLSIH